MSDIKEDVNININDQSEKDEIFDIDFSLELNAETGSEVSMVTDTINAEVLAAIISINKPAHINIAFEETPEINMYDKKDFVGSYYLPLRITPVGKSSNQFVTGLGSWYLNNKIRLTLKGQEGTVANITLRCC